MSSPPSLQGWHRLSKGAGGKAGKDFKRATSPQRTGSRRSPAHSRNTSTSSKSSFGKQGGRSPDLTYHGQYLAFYGSPLSNFHVAKSFRGSSAMPYLLNELERLEIMHPARDSIAVQKMEEHHFICGEQFMMACKGFLFELTTIPLFSDSIDIFAQNLRGAASSQIPNPFDDLNQQHEQFTNSVFWQILESTSPQHIKSLGRRTPNFNEEVWTKASKAVVIAASLARAEVNPQLSDIYKSAWNTTDNMPKHYFVEASPVDKVWGVGLGREDRKIRDRKLWKGENRLGHCHDEAMRLYMTKRQPKADFVQEIKELKEKTSEADQEKKVEIEKYGEAAPADVTTNDIAKDDEETSAEDQGTPGDKNHLNRQPTHPAWKEFIDNEDRGKKETTRESSSGH
ncbi:uncharacterized protein AB675_1918 [Cyphellophora attinorum]|uniref:NADAR domain-containing protein n=1 Tax=Cyphellophora attinorum TaxID=1664694 RepID=A0A0N1P0X8_9EURO|nr:uncharacterized protein AB675_1918 [Phialophora attinorum]KPI42773.1 hypothetical protein AB675_1918 [Phialophora attinorum]